MQNVLLIKAFEEGEEFNFINELAETYRSAAEEIGIASKEVNIYDLRFDFLIHSSKTNLSHLEPDLREVREHIIRAKHIVFFMPVLKREVPFKLKAFFDRFFALEQGRPIPALWEDIRFTDKTARIVSVTDDEVWREFKETRTSEYHPIHKNTLELFGIGSVYTTTIGPVKAGVQNNYRAKWINKIKELGAKGF